MSRSVPSFISRLLIGVVPVLALSVILAWAGSVEDRLKAVGAEALKPFKQQLMSALVKGLKDGPESAIQVCREKAPEIAAAAEQEGITIGRTSHRLRNPENAPEPWMVPLLEKYSGDPEITEPTLVPLPDGGHGYVEPIFIRPACLKCHGLTMTPGVEEKIGTLYPDDTARGFSEGDFRGLFWVRISTAHTERGE